MTFGAGHDVRVAPDSAVVTPDLIGGIILYVDASSYRRDGATEGLCDDGAGFFAGGDEGVARRDAGQKGGDVGGGDDFQEGVGCVVFEAADFAGGVVEGESLLGAEGADGGFVEAFLGADAEVVLVAEVNQSHDAPEVVDPVGVVEWHAPTVRLGREAAEEQDAGVGRQERFEGVSFGGLAGECRMPVCRRAGGYAFGSCVRTGCFAGGCVIGGYLILGLSHVVFCIVLKDTSLLAALDENCRGGHWA